MLKPITMNLLLLTITFPVLFSNETHVFSKIEKIYAKDHKKGITLANKYIKRDKSIASPYFFKLNNELECVENTNFSLLKRTTHLSNALSFGLKFEQLANDSFEEKINWESKKAEIEEATKAFLIHLQSNNSSKTKLIVSKIKKLNPRFEAVETIKKQDSLTENKVIEVATHESEKKPLIDKTTQQVVTEINYNLNPNGTENVPSANIKEETDLLSMINTERKKKGLNPLTIDQDLCRAARYHASDLANQGYFDHNTHNVKNNKLKKELSTFERIGLFYKGFANTENIAGGSANADGTYQQWFHSEGHHKNMLNQSATKVGIGFIKNEESPYTYYWVFCTAVE